MTPPASGAGHAPRRQLWAWLGLLSVTLSLTFGLSATIANLVVQPPGSATIQEPSYLTRHGRRCLDHVRAPDIDAHPAFSRWWQRLGEEDCRPGSWVAQFREFGQTFAQYQAEGPNRPEQDAPIVLTALGDFATRGDAGRAMVDPVREFLGLYYQRPAVTGPPTALPREAWHPERGAAGQFDAEALLEDLKDRCPDGAAGCLSVTDEDLYVNSLQYVFGLGHFHRRVGVFSLHRLWEPITDSVTAARMPAADPEPLRRALKVAAHEVGHEFTIAHCVHYRACVMAGTNSLAESDGGSLMLCPLDHEKLRWNLQFDPRERFAQLAAFAVRHQLHPEARYWSAMSQALPAGGPASAGGP